MYIELAPSGLQSIKGFSESDDLLYYMAGEPFSHELSSNDFFKKLYKDRNYTHIGEWNCVVYDHSRVVILSDEVGTIKWYYYHTENLFILSDNFWKICERIEPRVKDIDATVLYEHIIFGRALKNDSFITGIHITEPNVRLELDCNFFNLEKYEVDSLPYAHRTNLNRSEQYQLLDSVLSKTAKELSLINPNKRFAFSISGGLDSRLYLPFLKKFNKPFLFLFGRKKNFLEPFDARVARLMAKLFGYDLVMIDPDVTCPSRRIQVDMARNPTAESDMLKAVDYRDVFERYGIDVLVTGSYGGMVGGRRADPVVMNASPAELPSLILSRYSRLEEINSLRDFRRRGPGSTIKKILKSVYFVFKGHRQKSQSDPSKLAQKFLSQDYLICCEARNRVYKRLGERLNRPAHNSLTNIMKYHLENHSIQGGFESILGQVKSYSYYHPLVYNLSKSWSFEMLYNRKFVKDYLLKYHPRLASFPFQSYELPLKRSKSYFSNLFRRFFSVLFFKIRGTAIDYDKWWFNVEFQKEVEELMRADSNFFDLFNRDDVKQIFQLPSYSHIHQNLLKAGLLVRAIENREYGAYSTICDDLRHSGKY